MRTHRLGKYGPQISEIGFGAWAIGGPWKFGWGSVDDNVSIDAIQKAIDLGVNWIDTAPVYGFGHSENVVARAIEGRRKDILIATKCGLPFNERNRVIRNIRPESIRKEIEASLQRLGTEFIDLYQVHWPDNTTPVEEAWNTMVDLKTEGKVRYIGVSNFDIDMLIRCQAIHHIDSLQPPYNLLDRAVEKDLFPYCKKHGIGVIAYCPMHSGLLTGNFQLSKTSKDDWRRKDSRFQEPELSRHHELVEEVKLIARKYDKTAGQFSISWVLQNFAVTAAIVGARNSNQVLENVGGAGWRIKPDDMRKIDDTICRIYQKK